MLLRFMQSTLLWLFQSNGRDKFPALFYVVLKSFRIMSFPVNTVSMFSTFNLAF